MHTSHCIRPRFIFTLINKTFTGFCLIMNHQDVVIKRVFQKWQEYLASTNTEPMPRHECSSETCDFINEEDVYICPTTGELHCCGPDCDSIAMRQDNTVCTIRKRILPQLLRSPIITSEDYNTSRWTHGQATNSARETSTNLAAVAAKASRNSDTLRLVPDVLCLNIAFCTSVSSIAMPRTPTSTTMPHTSSTSTMPNSSSIFNASNNIVASPTSLGSSHGSDSSSVPSSPLSEHVPNKSAAPRDYAHGDPTTFVQLSLPKGPFLKKGTKRKASNKHRPVLNGNMEHTIANTCTDSTSSYKKAKTMPTSTNTSASHKSLATVQNAMAILSRLLVSPERVELQTSYDASMSDTQEPDAALHITTPKSLQQVLSMGVTTNSANKRQQQQSQRVISCADNVILQSRAKEMDDIVRICVSTYQQHIKTGNLSLLSKYSFDYHCVVVFYMMIDGFQTLNLSDPHKHLTILPKVPLLAKYLPERVDLLRFGYEYSRVNDTQHLFRKFRQLIGQ